MSKIYLSVVIPSYNEMVNLQKGVLDKVGHFLQKKFDQKGFEVMVVDDGSDDGSREFVEQFIRKNKNFNLIKNSHTGKAGAVTSGILAAKGEIVLFTDMDQATPIKEIDKLLPYFSDWDIVAGSRNNQRKGSPFSRIIMARGFMLLRTIILGLRGISDTQCGFKAFKKEAAQKLFGKINMLHHGFQTVSGSAVTAGFDVELLYLAQKLGYRIKEVPVNWLYVETRRVSPVRDSIDGLIDLLRIKYNDIKGLYD
ncbi:glycosyltransferase [Candidatus Microgenomates bacterium]|nr:glycosyltransferase [Candidatus Microgenomates bacterium]MBI2622199.1 glycosyltransferase [Candidatus Microgenomates bacterium]